MDITINKENVFKNVSMSVSSIARDLKDTNGNSLYDKVVIQERDKDFLGLFLDKAMGELTVLLRDFIIKKNGETISLDIKDRANTSLVKDVSVLAEDFISNRISFEWMKIKAVEYADGFNSLSETNASLIKEKLYYQNMPEDSDFNERYECSIVQADKYNGKYVFKIKLFKDPVLNDVDQELFMLYKRRSDGASVLMPNSIDGHSQLSLYIAKHINRLKERTAAYLSEFVSLNDADNRGPGYIFTFSMPQTWNPNYMEQLAGEMHGYLVNASLYDYLKSNYPDEAIIFSGAADAAFDNVKHYITSRVGGLRKPLQPF